MAKQLLNYLPTYFTAIEHQTKTATAIFFDCLPKFFSWPEKTIDKKGFQAHGNHI
jgi:hypothetical protein